MIGETLFVVWLVSVVYLTFLFWITREYAIELRRICNALVVAQAQEMVRSSQISTYTDEKKVQK